MTNAYLPRCFSQKMLSNINLPVHTTIGTVLVTSFNCFLVWVINGHWADSQHLSSFNFRKYLDNMYVTFKLARYLLKYFF